MYCTRNRRAHLPGDEKLGEILACSLSSQLAGAQAPKSSVSGLRGVLFQATDQRLHQIHYTLEGLADSVSPRETDKAFPKQHGAVSHAAFRK